MGVYYGIMEVWQQQLKQMLDQVSEYAYDWDQCLDMLASEPETKSLHAYLEFLVPRLKQMQREFNWVEYKDQCFRIHNYTYRFYQWVKDQGLNPIAVTPNHIVLHEDQLTPEQREQFRKRLR